MKKIFDWMPLHIAYLLRVFLTGMVAFTLLRIILFFIYYDHINTIPIDAGRLGLLLQAFWMGARFDIVISGYILALPFLALTFTALFNKEYSGLYRGVTVLLGVLYILAFALCFLDIPYFGYYNSRFSAIILDWVDDAGFLFKMVIQETINWIYFLFYIPWCITFGLVLRKINKNLQKEIAPASPKRGIPP